MDFIARMEGVSIHAAALKAIEWFHLDREAMSARSEEEMEERHEVPKGSTASTPLCAALTPYELQEERRKKKMEEREGGGDGKMR